MLRVCAKARIEGLHMAAWFWTKDKVHMPAFNIRDLEASNTIDKVEERFSLEEVADDIRSFTRRQENFSRKFLKPDDKVFASNVIDAYDYYVACFRALETIKRLGLTAPDLGLPEDRFQEYLSGEWSCPEDQQCCINLACEMTTADGVRAMLAKLLKAFSLHRSCGYMPYAWKASESLPEIMGSLQGAPVDKTVDKPVVCCFTVPAEVAEWLKGKDNMSRFVKGLIQEEMEQL